MTTALNRGRATRLDARDVEHTNETGEKREFDDFQEKHPDDRVDLAVELDEIASRAESRARELYALANSRRARMVESGKAYASAGDAERALRAAKEASATYGDADDDCDGKIAIQECVEACEKWLKASEALNAGVRAAKTASRRRRAAEASAECARALERGDLKSAAHAASTGSVILRERDDENDDTTEADLVAYDDARSAVRAFRAHVDAELASSIVTTTSRLTIDDERLARACEHLSIVGPDETRERFVEASKTIAGGFLEPMIQLGVANELTIVAEGGGALRYDTKPRIEGGGKDDLFDAQTCLEDSLRWIRGKIPSDDVAKAIGVNCWDDVAQACVSAWLGNHPSERTIDRTCAVEVVAASCGFVPPPSDGATAYPGGALGPLESKALATEMREAEKRRAAVLARARELALNDDPTMVRTAGEAGARGVGLGTGEETATSTGSSLLDGAPRTVSKAADLLAEHVDEVLRSAADLDPNAHRAATNLASTSADCLDLFRACVVSDRAEQLNSIHTAALVFYNDCHHLANRYSASVYARGAVMEQRIGRPLALLWVVEPLRALGDATRNAANERAMAELHAALDVAGGFLRSAEVKAKRNIDKSIVRARNVIQRAGTTSMYILPAPTGVRDAAELASHYARRIILEILSVDDISVEESEALTEIIAAAFASEGLVGAKGDDDAVRALVREVGSDWGKARELGTMLSAPLRDIAAAWERGRLRELGFTVSEIRGFIAALFSETPLRAECSAKII